MTSHQRAKDLGRSKRTPPVSSDKAYEESCVLMARPGLFFSDQSDHAAMSLSAGLGGGGGTTGYTTITSTAKHNNVHHATANR